MDVWSHEGELYEVVSGYDSSDDAWTYELTPLGATRGDDPSARPDQAVLEVRVPDATPDEGPFTPRPSDEVTVSWAGSGRLPWPVLRRFLALVESRGDIIGATPGDPSSEWRDDPHVSPPRRSLDGFTQTGDTS